VLDTAEWVVGCRYRAFCTQVASALPACARNRQTSHGRNRTVTFLSVVAMPSIRTTGLNRTPRHVTTRCNINRGEVLNYSRSVGRVRSNSQSLRGAQWWNGIWEMTPGPLCGGSAPMPLYMDIRETSQDITYLRCRRPRTPCFGLPSVGPLQHFLVLRPSAIILQPSRRRGDRLGTPPENVGRVVCCWPMCFFFRWRRYEGSSSLGASRIAVRSRRQPTFQDVSRSPS